MKRLILALFLAACAPAWSQTAHFNNVATAGTNTFANGIKIEGGSGDQNAGVFTDGDANLHLNSNAQSVNFGALGSQVMFYGANAVGAHVVSFQTNVMAIAFLNTGLNIYVRNGLVGDFVENSLVDPTNIVYQATPNGTFSVQSPAVGSTIKSHPSGGVQFALGTGAPLSDPGVGTNVVNGTVVADNYVGNVASTTNAQASLPISVLAQQMQLNREFMPTPILAPNATFIAAIQASQATHSQVNVVLVGTSITAASDLNFPNSAAQQLRQKLLNEIPGINWNVIDMAIPGSTMANLASGSFTAPGSYFYPVNSGQTTNAFDTDGMFWPNGSTNGLAWRDAIQYFQPHLIVLEDGMNDLPNADSFMQSFTNFYSYTQTWARKPWFALATMYLPTTNFPPYNLPGYQAAGRAIADFQRWTAISNGFGLIDMNAWYLFQRNGQREEQIPFSKASYMMDWPTNWVTVLGSAPTVTNATATTYFPSGSSVAYTNSYSRDVDLQATWVPITGSEVLGFTYRMTNSVASTSGFSAYYTPSSGAWNLYYGTNTVAFGTVGTNYQFGMRVKATGMRHEIWINNSEVCNTNYPLGMFYGYAGLGAYVGQANASYVLLNSATNYYANVPSVSAPGPLTEGYLLGTTNPVYPQLQYLDTGGAPNFRMGGNATNHLSVVGEFSTYNAAMCSFVEQMKRMLTVPIISYLPSVTISNLVSTNITVTGSLVADVGIQLGQAGNNIDGDGINLLFQANNSYFLFGNVGGLQEGSLETYGWTSTTPFAGTNDTALSRISPGVVAIGNGIAGNVAQGELLVGAVAGVLVSDQNQANIGQAILTNAPNFLTASAGTHTITLGATGLNLTNFPASTISYVTNFPVTGPDGNTWYVPAFR